MTNRKFKTKSSKNEIKKIKKEKTNQVPKHVEIDDLKERIKKETPMCSAAAQLNIHADSNETEAKVIECFSDLPISQKTLHGLKQNKFEKPTGIQKASISHALAERDILASAKTGSGKTLAFIIPVLENLYRKQWGREDGLGALIIAPTRELAIQIFEVLKSVGLKHSFSAGLIIGGQSRGKELKNERKRIFNINILICTPGRLLQHMDETSDFNCDNLEILVLDEADKLLEMGFQKDLNHILSNLPKTRQTLLFSATQTNSVQSLARLSLVSPEIISPHVDSEKATPSKLKQEFVIVEAHEKFELFFSFLKAHLKSKILVFVASRKQAQYLFEMFRRLRPGIPLSCIHGKQSQTRRSRIIDYFKLKNVGCLITTDICSRGLDIKNADWIVNFDCPCDTKTYIHRVGRTARYKACGNALLFLLPSETAMVELVREAKIPITENRKLKTVQLSTIKANAENKKSETTNDPNDSKSENPSAKIKDKRQKIDNTRVPLREKFASFLAESEELKYLAQRALICYGKAIANCGNKKIFDLKKFDLGKLSEAMGLANKPLISFSKKKKPEETRQKLKNANTNKLNGEEEKFAKVKIVEKDKFKNNKKSKSAVDKLIGKSNPEVYRTSKQNIKLKTKNDEEFFFEKKKE